MTTPRHLGSYQLVSRIGAGGMGEVWHGVHKHLKRAAAIKLIRSEALGPDAIERFQREARATSALKSPHTIQLFDFGIAPDGTFFYAMELLEGCSLQGLVANYGPICQERVVHILAQVCESLVEAHHQGLVHRDIKPANIFLSRLGMEVDFVKLLDFGLVKFDASSSFDAATLTLEDAAQGTPAFMPPEVTGGSTAFDARSDLYAVGCVAYWLLSGQLVFTGSAPLEVIMAHIQQQPETPSERTGLPIQPDLERLVMDCLAKDPTERPQTAREVLDRLQAVQLETPWDQERAVRWWSVHHPESWGVEAPLATVDPTEVGRFVARPPSSSQPWILAGGAIFAAGVLAWAVWSQTELAGTAAVPPPPEEPVAQPQPPPAPSVDPSPPMCTVSATGPAARWAAVVPALSDSVTWVEAADPDEVSAVLQFNAQKVASGAERWRSCRWVELRIGDSKTEICRECVTKEYTFATIEDVEAWHETFSSSLGRKCTDAAVEALDGHCAGGR